MKLPIACIEVGERRREEHGDIAALARSIGRHGLIHPIVVAGNRLVAGHRRLMACQKLGLEAVDVIDRGELSDEEVRELEWEENEERKDFTPHERSKWRIAKARKAVSELPIVGARADAGSAAVLDWQSTGHTRSEAADSIGVSEKALRRDEQHLTAVDAYPELETAPQSVAIEAAKALDALPEPEREAVRQEGPAAVTELAAQKRKRRARTPEEAERAKHVKAGYQHVLDAPEIQDADLRERWGKFAITLADRLTSFDPEALQAVLSAGEVQAARHVIRDVRTWLDAFEAVLNRPTLRAVGGTDDRP